MSAVRPELSVVAARRSQPLAAAEKRFAISATRLRAGARWRFAPSLATVPLRVLVRAPRPGSVHA